MNLFEKIIQEKELKCDICGYTMIVVHGCGWDNDNIYCSNTDCEAEIVFPTSTEYKEEIDKDPYCTCNPPELEAFSNKCRTCGNIARSFEFPFRCINCTKTFNQVHPLVTHSITDSGRYHKEIFCSPACEDHYYLKMQEK